MPQLWRSNSTGNGRGSRTMAPLVMPVAHHASNGTKNGSSPVSPPTNGHSSPTSPPSSPPMSPAAVHRHPPKYDQLVTELKRAQERRGRLLQSLAADDPSSPSSPSSPSPASIGVAAGAASTKTGADFAQRVHHQLPSSGAYVNHFASALTCKAPQQQQQQQKATTTKRVRFLEDGTGNLHTSVFGGSAESVGSLLDSHHELDGGSDNRATPIEDIDSLISSLISYSDAHDVRRPLPPPVPPTKPAVQSARPSVAASNGAETVDLRELRIPLSALSALKLNGQANGHVTTLDDEAAFDDDDDDDAIRCAEVVDQRQTVIHLEPDDPNSIDSGSVLSELDFEETSSTITDVDSTKTFSLSSPDYIADQRVDDWSQVSDLLEKSLQEIRQMEEDTNRSVPMRPLPPPPVVERVPAKKVTDSSPAVPKREPLYELIGWKRNPPPVELDLKGSKPHPLPPSPEQPPSPVLPPPALDPEPDIWVPRQDFVPPPSSQHQQHPAGKEKVWVRRPTLLASSNSSQTSINNGQSPARRINMFIEDNPLYGRVWETGSNNNGGSSGRSSTSSNDVDDKLMAGNDSSKSFADSDLSAIRSIARKARLEHWRLTGMPGPIPTEDQVQTSMNEQHCTLNPANLSALPLFNHRTRNGIQLTWPPPPLPQSPTSSSATATPVTPTLPPLPCADANNSNGNGTSCANSNGHSPKCFGHQRVFQWPVPALKMPKSPPVQRRVSPAKETTPERSWRPIKPANMEDAQNWYWTEEFPSAAGLEPGTGSMSAWFHGAISRTEAERRLTNQPTGAFLVRLTERLWGYAVSVRAQTGNISHFLVDAGERRGHKRYSLLGSNDPTHKTLRELIQYYGKNAMTPDRCEKLLFPCPQESSVACLGSTPGHHQRLIKSP